jgi:hypothetical protein
MPIPLGILAVAGAGGGAVPAFELIETSLVSSDTTSVTLSSIPQTYKHLQVRWTGRNNQNWGSIGSSPGFWIQINGVTSSSYSTHRLIGNGSSVSSGANTSLDYIRFTSILANAFGPTSSFGAGVIDIVDYTNTATNKTVRSLAGYNSNSTEIGGVSLSSGALISTGAVSSITLGAGNGPAGGGQFVSGSRFSLYGIKGA